MKKNYQKPLMDVVTLQLLKVVQSSITPQLKRTTEKVDTEGAALSNKRSTYSDYDVGESLLW